MRFDARFVVRLIVAGAAVVWATALPLAVFAARLSDGAPSTSSVLALAVYEIGGLVCHQRPERSFHLADLPMPAGSMPARRSPRSSRRYGSEVLRQSS
jgi:hypothetical protein